MKYPKGPKSTWLLQANAIASGNIEVAEAEIPKLLEWLQDMNWPGTSVIAQYLLTFGTALIEPMRHVLRTEDKIWTNWVLLTFQNEFDLKFWQLLSTDLTFVASHFDEEYAHVPAMFILAKWSIVPKEKLAHQIKEFKLLPNCNDQEYVYLEKLLLSKQ